MNNVQGTASQLAARGAILALLHLDAQIVIGALDWLDDHRIFFFEAGALDEFGAHVLDFDRANAPHDLGVEFYDKHNRLIAYLAPIAESVDEPELYERTFLQWQRSGSAMTDFIATVKQKLTE